MQDQLSGAIIRLHGPLNLHLWDRIVTVAGGGFVILSLPLAVYGEALAALVSLVGGVGILWRSSYDRRRHQLAVWAMAADEDDPIAALALYDYLYRLRFRDLLVVADWRATREAQGLPIDYDDLDAPPQVRAMGERLRDVPHEC